MKITKKGIKYVMEVFIFFVLHNMIKETELQNRLVAGAEYNNTSTSLD